MKRYVWTAVLLFIFIACIPLHGQWARHYGGSGDDWANFIQQTSDGGYIIAANTESFGVEQSDIWIIKLSLSGKIEWQLTYGGSQDEEVYAVREASGGGYIVAGYTDSFGAGKTDFWVLKLDSEGDVEWQSTYGGSGDEWATSVQQTSEGGYVVGGSSDSFGNGEFGYWVLKLDADGDVEWQSIYSLNVDSYLNSVQEVSGGGYILAGHVNPSIQGGYDVWILKLSSIGVINWQRYYGGNQDDWANFIQETEEGGYVAAGYTNSFGSGGWDFWVLNLNSEGDILWEKTYGRSGDDWANSAQQTSDGGFIVAGYTDSFGAGLSDFWLLKLSASGIIEWQRTYGGIGSDAAFSVQQTDDSGFIVAGDTGSYSAGGLDLLVLKLYSDGEIDPVCELPGSTSATVYNTGAASMSTLIPVRETNAFPQDTDVVPYTSDSDAYLICEDRPEISGTVKDEGDSGIEGVTLTFSGEEGTATTDVNGNYSLDVSFGWSGTVTPSKNGYEFTPSSREYAEVTSDQTGEDYTGYVVYVISGFIRTAALEGIEEVTITFSNSGGEATTAADGSYAHYVREGWTGTATPFKVCYDFTPLSIDYAAPVMSDQPDQNYTGTLRTYTISGTITAVSGPVTVSGVVMSGLPGNPVTDGSGNYTATVDCGWSGTVTPTKDRAVFFPASSTYSSVSSDQSQNYDAYLGWYISGVIQTDEGAPLPGVTVTFVDSIDSTITITGVDGSYAHLVKHNEAVTATPSRIGYEFTPPSRDHPAVTSDIPGQDYTASLVQHTLTISAEEGGTTQPAPGSHIYDFGTDVEVNAVPDKGYAFSQWSGDIPGSQAYSNPVVITMDSDKSLTAEFKKEKLCFVATAAYGNPSHPHVKILRDFRDAYLMRSPFGRTLVGIYYRYSPAAAEIISKHAVLRMAARIHLLPAVALSYALLCSGPGIPVFALVLIFILAVRFSRWGRSPK